MTQFNNLPQRPADHHPSRVTTVLAILLALTVVWGCWQTARNLGAGAAQPRPVTPRAELAAEEKTAVEIFEDVSPSVAYISPVDRVRNVFSQNVMEIERGTGSGFVWDKDGHVVTNYHVISGADACRVTLWDNSTWYAKIVGVEPDKDLAVLHIGAQPDALAPVAIGTSHDLKVGQEVYAIGNPFGLDYTLTAGVVSALNREIQAVSGRTIEGVIQTDAAINPGNSGGPLIDSAARLIGINTSIYSPSGTSAGISFAVPVDVINQVVPQLITYGRVIRPGLGVTPFSDQVAARLRVPGVLVRTVSKGSAADRAGMRPTRQRRDGRIVLGDIITKVGDTPTPTLNNLLNALERFQIGDTVPVTIIRDGQQETLEVNLQAIK